MLSRLLAIGLSALALGACAHGAGSTQRPQPVLGAEGGVDHVLVWTRDEQAATRILRDRLGFTVGPASAYPDGIASKALAFGDRSYIQLLFATDPETARRQAPTETAMLDLSYGPSSFGLRADDLAAVRKRLEGSGVAIDPAAPSQTSSWATLTLAQGLIAGEPFFVEYAGDAPEPGADGPPVTSSRHENGARRLTAVWVLAPDLDEAVAQYARLGFVESRPVPSPIPGATAMAIRAGTGWVLLVEPGTSDAAQAAGRWPHKIFGVSVEVARLSETRARLKKGEPAAPRIYRGPFGDAVRVDTRRDLGLYVEFHQGR